MTVIMRPSVELTEIYLYRQAIDFRKSHHGLAAIIECELGRNPFDGGLFAFTNKQRTKIKCLFWDNTGFVLYYKALAEDKFKWPKGNEILLTLTGQQLNWLLDGYDISLMKGHKIRHYESVF